MPFLFIVLKCVGVYLIFFLPQLRLQNYQYDPHIGIMTASRVSGLPLSRIFFLHSFGMPLPVLSFSLQYDRFHSNLSKYKLFHAVLISFTGPLFYLFAFLLTGREDVSLVATLFYAVSFHFPIVGNWLIQPEHYEILFFLAGASLALEGNAIESLSLTVAGAFVMGCSLLCKLPGLASVWVMALIISGTLTDGVVPVAASVLAYLAPFVIFCTVGKIFANTAGTIACGGREDGKGFTDLIKSTIARYLTYYKSNPQNYINIYIKYHLSRYVIQFLPLLFLAAVYLSQGDIPRKSAIVQGLAIVSLIFVLRMGFAYVYSFNIVISIAASLAFFTIPAHFLVLVTGMSSILGLVAAVMIARDPSGNVYRQKTTVITAYDMLAKHIKETLAPGQTWFSNINRSWSFLYPLSERGFSTYFSIVLMGAYGPRINHTCVQPVVAMEGIDLAKALAATPPDYLVQSATEWPILNLSAVEEYCGLSYRMETILGTFAIYRLAERRTITFDPSLIDIAVLFNADQGMNDTLASAELFMEQIKSAATSQEINQQLTIEEPVMSVQSDPVKHQVCLFLNTYYVNFLYRIYHDRPQMASLSYGSQLDILQGTCFGDSNFYSRGLDKAGWHAADLIVNCQELQLAWARENNFASGDMIAIMLEQIRRVKPSVVYFQDASIATPDVLREIRAVSSLLVLQIASPIPQHVDFASFDVVFTAAPHFVEIFRKSGLASYYQPLAFDPRCVATAPSYQNRSIDVSFVGGLSVQHIARYELFEYLASTTPILYWGYGAELLPAESVARARHQGEAWGKEMFQILKNSKITINRHIEIAENYACNMRLYEATGAGTLLITEYKDNLNELFEIGKEVIAYRSPEECAELINYYLAHPEEAEAIACAGQARTLRDHIYEKRMEQTAEILERHLRYRREKDRYTAPDMATISFGHSIIDKSEISKIMTSAWQDSTIPARQRALVQQSLAAMYKGADIGEYRLLAELLNPYIHSGSTILEIGCSSGYVYEILGYYLNKRMDYTGIDYSEAMIAMAEDYYPKVRFFVADGASLFFGDQQFHTVISSCILLHVPNYREHIFETARVASRFIVASRTPVCKLRPTQFLKKFAYGVETVELIFNEGEFVREFAINSFALVHAVEYQSNPAEDVYHTMYLFKRI